MMKKLLFFFSLSTLFISQPLESVENQVQEIPFVIIPNVWHEAKKNENWKVAAASGKQGQVVFMSVSPLTNPQNEIGLETHPFDQVIWIVKGKANAILNEQLVYLKKGDMIFIPAGTKHNLKNLSQDKPLKLISFYSENDIPKNSVYRKKGDESGQ